MVSRVGKLLARCGTDAAVMPPTALFNEGWMLRLILDWYATNPSSDRRLAFMPGARWYSEALLASQFGPRFRADPLAEGFTHADGVIGHFRLRPDRGDVTLDAGARQLLVTEAKMFSALSAGTTRAKEFDQAARNAACIAHLLSSAELAPERLDALALYVLAPKEQWERGVFGDLLSKDSIRVKVEQRCAAYDGAKAEWLTRWFEPTLDRMRVAFVSWEELCADVADQDEEAGSELFEFLARCIEYNRPRSMSAAT